MRTSWVGTLVVVVMVAGCGVDASVAEDDVLEVESGDAKQDGFDTHRLLFSFRPERRHTVEDTVKEQWLEGSATVTAKSERGVLVSVEPQVFKMPPGFLLNLKVEDDETLQGKIATGFLVYIRPAGQTTWSKLVDRPLRWIRLVSSEPKELWQVWGDAWSAKCEGGEKTCSGQFEHATSPLPLADSEIRMVAFPFWVKGGWAEKAYPHHFTVQGGPHATAAPVVEGKCEWGCGGE